MRGKSLYWDGEVNMQIKTANGKKKLVISKREWRAIGKKAQWSVELVSDCCGAEDGPVSIDGPSWSDVGICPDCREHCEFVEADDEPCESCRGSGVRNPDIINSRPCDSCGGTGKKKDDIGLSADEYRHFTEI